MAEVTKIAGSVHPLSMSRSPLSFVAGETMSAGDVVFLSTGGKVYKAKNDNAEHANAIGVVVGGGEDGAVNAGEAVDVAFDGLVSGFTGTSGTTVYVGATAGTLEDAAPGSGKYKFAVGVICPEGLMLRLAAEPVVVA